MVDMHLQMGGEHERPDGGGAHVRVHVQLSVGSLMAIRRRQIERELGPAPSLAFLDSRTVQELKMGDIQRLLNEYRWLSRALKPHVPPHTSTGKAEGTEAAELAIATPLRAVPNDV